MKTQKQISEPPSAHSVFVAGAKWWQYHCNGSTAFPSEVDAMEAEALRRFGHVNAQDEIGQVITELTTRFDAELIAKSAEEIAAEWYFSWEENSGVVWNTYKFSDILESHKRRWRRWEEHHNGSCCIVERVRDKYVMARVREFLAALAAH